MTARDGILRVATYNIHKGVQGLGPARRLEIHNLGLAIEALDADVICLQEVRAGNRREARHFVRWPAQNQADFLAPLGYDAVYRTNAVTRDGEHGNALLSRWPILACNHEDVSDHRFEQRGVLHVALQVDGRPVHVLVVHLGLIRGSRVRQVRRLKTIIERHVPQEAPLVLAGDFNDPGAWLQDAMRDVGLQGLGAAVLPTFPARLPLLALDHVFARGLQLLRTSVPQGRAWWRMSDHLPLIAEFALPDSPKCHA